MTTGGGGFVPPPPVDENLACKVRFLLSVKVKFADELTLELFSYHPSKRKPEFGVAVTVLEVPAVNVPPPETVPPAVLLRVRVMVWVVGGRVGGRQFIAALTAA